MYSTVLSCKSPLFILLCSYPSRNPDPLSLSVTLTLSLSITLTLFSSCNPNPNPLSPCYPNPLFSYHSNSLFSRNSNSIYFISCLYYFYSYLTSLSSSFSLYYTTFNSTLNPFSFCSSYSTLSQNKPSSILPSFYYLSFASSLLSSSTILLYLLFSFSTFFLLNLFSS